MIKIDDLDRVVKPEPEFELEPPHPQLRGFVEYAHQVGKQLLYLRSGVGESGGGESGGVTVPSRVYVFFHGVWLLTWVLVVLLVVRLFPKFKLWRFCSHNRFVV